MQQLKIEHKNTTKKNRREGKGRVLAISRNVYHLLNSDIYYVESESSDNVYYCVKYNPSSALEWWCSCKDNSLRHVTCKHLISIEFAIKWGTIKDIDSPLTNVKGDTTIITTISTTTTKPMIASISNSSSSYKDDEYTF